MRNDGYRLLNIIQGYDFHWVKELQERCPKQANFIPFNEIELKVEENNLSIEDLIKDFIKTRTY